MIFEADIIHAIKFWEPWNYSQFFSICLIKANHVLDR